MQLDPTRDAAALLLRTIDDLDTPPAQKVRAAASLARLAEGVILCEGAWYALRLDAADWLAHARGELSYAVEAAKLQAWLFRRTLESGDVVRSPGAALGLARLAEEWLSLDARTLERLDVDEFRAWRDEAAAAQLGEELRGAA